MKSSTFLLKKSLAAAVLAFSLLSLCSCQKKNKASFIILAVDRLSFNGFSCSDEKSSAQSGLVALCQESIRYTNAYTTSTQPAAALGSFLSGTYPYKNSLHRSFDRISADLPLLPEFFKKAGYRTAFFSGGPSLLKKTGLSRGFELFDDSTFLNQINFTTSFSEQVKSFSNWVEESDEPFLTVIYNSEMESFNETIGTSQIETFDEKLGRFIHEMKSQYLWEKNYFIVMGLQGRSEYSRTDENPFSNLHTENINVAFFIKPPRQKGDEGINLKVDSPSSLADFGYSMIRMIDPGFKRTPDPVFSVWDYSTLWSKSQLGGSTPPFSRKIVVESPDTWKKKLSIKFASVFGHYIFIEGQEPSLFNRLNDGLETINLGKTSPDMITENSIELSQLHRLTGAEIWMGPSPEEQEMAETNKKYWNSPEQREVIFENEKKRLANEKRPHPLSTLLIYYQNTKREKDLVYDEARRMSYNLALENAWGLWDWNKPWPQPGVMTENQ